MLFSSGDRADHYIAPSPPSRINLAKVYDWQTHVIDVDLVDIEVVVKNDSGTFKPSDGGIAAFAWTLMKALNANRVGFEAFGADTLSGFVEDQGYSTWGEFRAANQALGDD